jgi:hypothetical protein
LKSSKKHPKISEVYEEKYGDDHIDQLEKRSLKAKKKSRPEPKKRHHEEDPEMPMEVFGNESGSTAVLDDEAPIESAPKHTQKLSHKESKSKFMSADDTDHDGEEMPSPKKGVSLIHHSKGVEIKEKSDFDKKMQKKDKASE